MMYAHFFAYYKPTRWQKFRYWISDWSVFIDNIKRVFCKKETYEEALTSFDNKMCGRSSYVVIN